MDSMEEQKDSKELGQVVENPTVNEFLDEKAKGTDDVNQFVDLLTTRNALAQQGTINMLVEEKGEELRNRAESKRIQAETEKIDEEVKKEIAEKEKQIAEYDKQITAKRKEVEELKAQADEEDAYFQRNKEILKYFNVRSKKSLKAMQVLMVPSMVIFFVVQILIFPITFCGLIIESLINIVGGVCGSIKSNAIKIIVAILVIAILVGAFVCAYYFGGDFIIESCNG